MKLSGDYLRKRYKVTILNKPAWSNGQVVDLNKMNESILSIIEFCIASTFQSQSHSIAGLGKHTHLHTVYRVYKNLLNFQ